jgi:hypothetical protein
MVISSIEYFGEMEQDYWRHGQDYQTSQLPRSPSVTRE